MTEGRAPFANIDYSLEWWLQKAAKKKKLGDCRKPEKPRNQIIKCSDHYRNPNDNSEFRFVFSDLKL